MPHWYRSELLLRNMGLGFWIIWTCNLYPLTLLLSNFSICFIYAFVMCLMSWIFFPWRKKKSNWLHFAGTRVIYDSSSTCNSKSYFKCWPGGITDWLLWNQWSLCGMLNMQFILVEITNDKAIRVMMSNNCGMQVVALANQKLLGLNSVSASNSECV